MDIGSRLSKFFSELFSSGEMIVAVAVTLLIFTILYFND